MQHKHDVDIRTDDIGYTMRCVWCGTEFYPKRYDAAFCSPKCRLANHRAPQKRANTIAFIESVGNTLICASGTYSTSKDVFAAMLKLQQRLRTALNNFEAEFAPTLEKR
jgi:predicted nucleic acid-binding Zn ribbon protein